jgi:hypothetical protein
VPARGKAGDHRALRLELLGVVVGVLQHHRVHVGLEAVAVGLASGAQSQRGDRHDIGAMQRDQAMRRAHEVHAGPAVGELVLHDLRDGQLRERLGDRLLQALGQRRAGHDAVEEQRFGLAVEAARQARHCRRIGAEAGEALQQCRGRLAARVEADTHRHELLRDRLVLGLRAHTTDVRGQTPRRGERGGGRVFPGQPLRAQALGQRRGKCVTKLLQRFRRQLFDEQFDEQVLRGHAQAAFFSAIWALTSSAQALGAIGKPRRARLSR